MVYLFNVLNHCNSLYNFSQIWENFDSKKVGMTYSLKWSTKFWI